MLGTAVNGIFAKPLKHLRGQDVLYYGHWSTGGGLYLEDKFMTCHHSSLMTHDT